MENNFFWIVSAQLQLGIDLQIT